ncbi:MAG TPA: sigma-54 dependent transcriptional regulator, partial [bacterium]|nr:sigma-54 dependent transcriptional regulator [bacterium]
MSYTLLCIDDDPDFLNNINLALSKHYEVILCQNFRTARLILDEKDIDLVLLDIHLDQEDGIEVLKSIKSLYPQIEVMMLSGDRHARQIVESMKLGACDYLTKDTNTSEIMSYIDRILGHKHTRDRLSAMISDVKAPAQQQQIMGTSQEISRLLSQAGRAKGVGVNVLIQGETGTGKGALARYLHDLEGTNQRPFITLHCAETPVNSLESELFGHEKGSSVGAHQRKLGKIELADGGDLFLAQVDQLSEELQLKLLQVLKTNEVFRLGAVKPLKVSFRLIVSTSKDLPILVRQKQFRDDLYQRCCTLRLNVPALRERISDLDALTDYFLEKCNAAHGDANRKTLHPEVREALKNYEWPGNVKQLESLMQSLVTVTEQTQIGINDLPLGVARATFLKDQPTLTMSKIGGALYRMN